ncbi:MAG TPA: cation:proton antiporter [Gemmatimonadales bacterium]|jgi:Kef-type K+ transport system membrane component KefB|nr:cation:proton antiporter [Gemmatimonadales bacterium]
MRRVATLFAVGLMMALFHRVTADGPLEARATLALGFLVLTALVGGEFARQARLPRITGYLVLGFAVGPAWLGLVRRDELDALRFFGDAAVTVLALAAGAELDLSALRRGRLALGRLATGAIAFPFVAVTLVALTVSRWFPITVHHRFGDGVAVALVLGTLAAASSPVITMAVMGERDARGPVARTLLGVTILQVGAVALLFALVLALSKPWTSAGALNRAIAGEALVAFVGSVALGAALGFALGAYLPRMPRYPVPVLVAVALGTAEVAGLLRFEALLIALTAGFWLENFARPAAQPLRLELKRALVPASVVLFALAGAGLKLKALAELWPWVLLLAGLRVMSLRAGFWWAGRHPSVPPALAQEGWLTLVSQAGFALGLAQLARRAFPEWGVSLEALIVAMIGVHEVAGPICAQRALALAEAVREETHDAQGGAGAGPGVSGGGGTNAAGVVAARESSA